jgi:hypothetical protein
MLVLWQNYGGGFGDEEVEVQGGTDRLCSAACLLMDMDLAYNLIRNATWVIDVKDIVKLFA